MAFLDTVIKKEGRRLKTDLYTKPTDSHSYLRFESAHPRNCKISIPYSQFLRVRRICTDIEDFDTHAKVLASHIVNRGYPVNLVAEAVVRARQLDKNVLLAPKETGTDEEDCVVLTTQYHPFDNTVAETVKKNWDILGKAELRENSTERNSSGSTGGLRTYGICWFKLS